MDRQERSGVGGARGSHVTPDVRGRGRGGGGVRKPSRPGGAAWKGEGLRRALILGGGSGCVGEGRAVLRMGGVKSHFGEEV